MKNYLRLLYKQGVFTGDLNSVQQFCLSWALMDESEDRITLEEERMKYTILAGQPEIYKKMYIDTEQSLLQLDEDEWESMEEIEEDMAQVFSEIETWESQRDSL